MDRVEIASLWKTHSQERWPSLSTPKEGELMTLDTVISGCVVYYLESPEGLDRARVDILNDCLSDVDGLLPDLTGDGQVYFQRLKILAERLLATRSER